MPSTSCSFLHIRSWRRPSAKSNKSKISGISEQELTWADCACNRSRNSPVSNRHRLSRTKPIISRSTHSRTQTCFHSTVLCWASHIARTSFACLQMSSDLVQAWLDLSKRTCEEHAGSGNGHHIRIQRISLRLGGRHTQRQAARPFISARVSFATNRGCSISTLQKNSRETLPTILSIFIGLGCTAFGIWMNLVQVTNKAIAQMNADCKVEKACWVQFANMWQDCSLTAVQRKTAFV